MYNSLLAFSEAKLTYYPGCSVYCVKMQTPSPPASCLSRAKLYQVLVDHLAASIALILQTDAHGDLLRGLQVVETAIGITSNLLGDKLEGRSGYFHR
jgi:hypothetical protein